MKKHLTFILLSLFLTLPLLALEHHEQETISKRLEKGFAALAKQDWQTLESLCTSDWQIILHTGARLNMDGLKEFFTGHISEHSIEISNIQVHLSADGAMAWATFDEKTSYKFDGNPMSEKAVFTSILVKDGENWKTRALQRTILQPPPPAMTEKQ